MMPITYPIIVETFDDEDGHYYVATSPNIPGMVTQGLTMAELKIQAKDAIMTVLDGLDHDPQPQDPSNWSLTQQEQVLWITVDMAEWHD